MEQENVVKLVCKTARKTFKNILCNVIAIECVDEYRWMMRQNC